MSKEPPSPGGSDAQFLGQVRRAGQAVSSGPHGQSTETASDSPFRLPERIGQYHVKGVLASGGMGTVYRAVQEHPRRTVAVKVMRHGIASRSAMRRFEYESQILARLHHPGIAQVYEAGTHDDGTGVVPYFAMEYIPNAKPITDYTKEKKLGTRERLELFTHVCEAVHHGHQKGIIHRDLKPGNILVDSHGEVKIIDFGVARGTDSDMAVTTQQTDIGQLIGTLQYMSPEQCEADPDDIDTRSDVYALGVVLYELVSGKLPYKVSSSKIYEATRTIREQEPTKLTTINKALRGDVETVVLKALEKDRDRRYRSAADLADDVNRYLRGESISARPPSMVYQLRVFARRNKALVTGVVAVVLALTLGVIGTTAGLIRAERQRQLAENARLEAANQATKAETTLSFLQERLEAVDPSVSRGQELTVRSMLDETARRLDGGEFDGQPEAEASVRVTLGKTYLGLGLVENAERQLRAAEEIQKRELGDEDPETLRTRAMLGKVLWHRAKHKDAESLLRGTVDAQRRIVGEEDQDTLFTMNNLAITLEYLGKYDEAEDLYRTTLATQRRLLGDEHPDTLKSMHDLSVLLGLLGKHREHEQLIRKTLETERRVLGDEHPATLLSMQVLGGSLINQGKLAEAETLFRKVLDARRRVLGDDHPAFRATKLELAYLLATQGKMDEAESYFRDLIAQGERDSQAVDADAAVLARYAEGLLFAEPRHLRDPEAALVPAKRAVELTGGTDPDYLDTLAIAYEMTGDIDKAVENEKQVVALLGPGESWYRTLYGTRLMSFLREQGDGSAADEMLDAKLKQVRQEYGQKQAELVGRMTEVIVLSNLRGSLLATDQQLCSELTQAQRGVVSQDGPGLAEGAVLYAATQLKRTEYTEAEELLQHCLEIRKLAHGDTDWRTAHVTSVLGAVLTGQGKFAEAEPLLLEAYNQMKDNAETIPEYYRDERIRQALERVVDLYESWDATDPGKGYADKAAQWRAKLAEGEGALQLSRPTAADPVAPATTNPP